MRDSSWRRRVLWWVVAQAAFVLSPTLAATPEVTAPHAMVVASSGDGAADAGLELLKRGGTAMDAAMAVAMAQPCHAMGSFVSYAGMGGQVPMVNAIPATEHTDAIVAVDAMGNVAAVVHSINTVNWGSTGLFIDGVSIPDSASFQQRVIASLPPGSRLPATTHPGMVLKDGKGVLGFGNTGTGSMTRSIAVLLNVLGHGMTLQEAIDEPSLGAFEFERGPPPEVFVTVGRGEFDEAYLKSLHELGQGTRVSNSARGYWLGVAIDPKTGTRHAGIMREFPQLAGGAVGY